MWVWYNDKLLQEKNLILHPSNRAFQYGDGIFETIIIRNGKIVHCEYHERRISHSIKVLQLEFKLSFDELIRRIDFLLKKNKVKMARAKLVIWRAPGGYYVPENSDSEFLITLSEYKEPQEKIHKVAFSEKIKIPKGLTQNCKTLNSLPYILAGLELKERKEFNDLILLDIDGHISECISSNIFWMRKGEFFTPSLESNCIMGVKRAYIIDKLKEKNHVIHEVLVFPEELLEAEYVFKTNVTGVFSISQINDQSFDPEFMLPEFL